MKKEANVGLPPFREPLKLSEQNEQILSRFVEELERRTGSSLTIEVYKETLLVSPSVHPDTIKLEVIVGRWKRVHMISEFELDSMVGGSFYYFCRRVADEVMSDLIRIGAARA